MQRWFSVCQLRSFIFYIAKNKQYGIINYKMISINKPQSCLPHVHCIKRRKFPIYCNSIQHSVCTNALKNQWCHVCAVRTTHATDWHCTLMMRNNSWAQTKQNGAPYNAGRSSNSTKLTLDSWRVCSLCTIHTWIRQKPNATGDVSFHCWCFMHIKYE